MAKGKRLSNEEIYNIMASFAATNNLKETSRVLGVPLSTVGKIVNDNKDKPEYVELWNKKKGEFAEKASVLIDKYLELALRKVDTLLTDDEQLAKLKPGDITTALGTLYDKRALAKGESTQNENIEVNIKIV